MFVCLSVFLSVSHFELINYTLYDNMSLLDIMGSYRPQCSYGKVMFLHLSVILSMGGVCPSACWDTPPDRHPQADTPSGQTPPLGRHPLWADTPSGQTPPLGRHPLWTDPLAQYMLGYTPPAQCILGYTTPLAQCILRYTWLLLRTVRILLECILVNE